MSNPEMWKDIALSDVQEILDKEIKRYEAQLGDADMFGAAFVRSFVDLGRYWIEGIEEDDGTPGVISNARFRAICYNYMQLAARKSQDVYHVGYGSAVGKLIATATAAAYFDFARTLDKMADGLFIENWGSIPER